MLMMGYFLCKLSKGLWFAALIKIYEEIRLFAVLGLFQVGIASVASRFPFRGQELV
jgi:hypothetical protein